MPPGSLVLVHRVPDSTLRVGDVITYTNPMTMKSTLTHRIIKIDKQPHRALTLETKGDANPSPDQPVVAGLVKGRMVSHVPYLGMFLMWAKTWVGISVLVYLPALIITINEIRRLRDYFKKIMPYHLYPVHHEPVVSRPVKYAAGLATLTLTAGLAFGPAVLAVGQTNTVSLSPNTISVAAPSKLPTNTSCTNDIHINNTSDQTAQTGSATTSGNTNGNGSATSGSASNSSSTTVNVNTTGC